MATNTLTRTEASNELFVYRYTQPSGSAEASVVNLSMPTTGYNNPFNESSGQWRILNLRVDGGNYNAELEFGFKNNDTSKPLSGICGFTVGQPPLYATHINTIAKSIAYGFINNPFTATDGLYIVHENTLVQVTGTFDIAALRIVIKNGTASYYSGNRLILESIMGITSCPLYVAAALGYAGNQVSDIGISGASGYTLPVPDYTKELYFLCSGLTATSPRYPGRLADPAIAIGSLTHLAIRTSAAFTVSYPDENVNIGASAGTNYQILTKEYSGVPFVIKLTFASLANLTGLRFVNGAAGTGTSLSRSLASLTGLKELEVRGGTEGRTLGKNTFPTGLESLYLHGNHEISNPLNIMPALKSLRYLEQKENTTSNIELLRFPNLQLLEIPVGAAWAISSFESLQNFRLMFNPIRNTTTHGFYGTALVNANQFIVLTNLAIAQQSATLLYGWPIQNSGNNSFISNLSSYASQVSGFLSNSSRGDSITISSNVITLTITASITTEVDSFLSANQFILLKKSDNTLKQLRKIASVNKPNGTTYTITLDRVKTDITCGTVTIAAGTDANTFVMSGPSIAGSIGNIRVGDTVRVSSVTMPISGTAAPSIVISKTNNTVTVLKGTTVADGIAAIPSATVVFGYEFSTANHPTSVTSPSTTQSEIHLSTGTRAIYQYLI